jgi:hypothetical protein
LQFHRKGWVAFVIASDTLAQPMRSIQFAVLFVLSLLLLTQPAKASETLADVLSTHKIPVNLFSASDRQKHITSFAVSDGNSPFLLAYYDDDGSGMLRGILHIIRFDEHSDNLRRADLPGTEVQFHGFTGVMGQVPSVCMGSALSISEKDGFIAINTHINPSAGCVLILTSELSFSAALWGGARARVDGYLLVDGNMIHFAPTHPASLAVYNPRQKQLSLIYPAKIDPARHQFSAELQGHLASEDWCRQQNNACDPKIFSTDITNLKVNEVAHSFAFDALMSPEGFGKGAEESVKSRTIHYVCRLQHGKWILTAK